MKSNHILAIFLLLLFLIISTGCENMESHWQDAQSKNAIEAYEQFIKDYPQSPYAEEAKIKIFELQFEYAKNENTIQGYQKFLEKYPKDSHTEDVQSKITELQYDKVKQKNTTEDYKKFIEQYPQSSYASDAQNAILSIYANKIKTGKSLKDKEAVEDMMVKEISKNGVGSRFKIESILPEKNGHAGSIAAEQSNSNSNIVMLKTLYPKDELLFPLSLFGPSEPIKPLGDKSIWRFIGKIEFMDHTFIGDKKEPLTFMLWRGVGFIYLHGTGKVIKNNKTIVSLPQEKT